MNDILSYINKKIVFYFIIIFTCILLTACTATEKLLVTPDSLSDATLGKPYYAKIIIRGGSGHVSAGSFDYSITPENSGLNLIPDFSVPTSYNHLMIKGIPNNLDDIIVNIQGETVNTVFWHSSQKLNKTYIIKVKEPE